MSVWYPTDEEKRRERFWNTAPDDPVALARKADRSHYNRALGKVLMPQSHMPLGEHRDKIMTAVPAAYLAWVQAQPWAAAWEAWAPVADYLSRHPLDPRETEHPATLIFVSPPIACEPTDTWKWDRYAELTGLREHEDKLHAFAQGALRLRREWAVPATAKTPLHYRLSLARRHLAIQAGAYPLDPNPKAQAAHRQHLRDLSQESPCTKHGYADETEAKLVMLRLTSKRHNFDRRKVPALRTYECPKCGFWHLTKQELRQ